MTKTNSDDTTSVRPTAEEVCRTIELMAMFADDDDKIMSLIYRMTHVREGDATCKHDDWTEELRKHQAYWENVNKAPRDKTKLQDMEYPSVEQ